MKPAEVIANDLETQPIQNGCTLLEFRWEECWQPNSNVIKEKELPGGKSNRDNNKYHLKTITL